MLLPGLASCLVAFAWGCQGTISGGPTGNSTAGSSLTGATGTGSTPTPANIGDVVSVDPQQLPDGVPPNTRVSRLSYEEYDRAMSDLFELRPVEICEERHTRERLELDHRLRSLTSRLKPTTRLSRY